MRDFGGKNTDELSNAALPAALYRENLRGGRSRGIVRSELQGASLRKAHGSFFPLRGVLRLRLGVRRLRNLERPRRRDPTSRNQRGALVVAFHPKGAVLQCATPLFRCAGSLSQARVDG
jgi:hypothetical protein